MTTTFTRRALTTGDAAGIAAMHAAIEGAEPTDEMFSETDILEELQDPSVDLASSSLGVFDDELLVGYGVLGVSSTAPIWKGVLSGGVLPHHSGQGIGGRILVDLEAMALRSRDRDAAGLPGELKIYVHDNRSRTAHLAATAGYEPWRYFFRMRRGLSGALPAVDVPGGVRIRRCRDADEEPLRTVSNESFADHWGSSPLDPARWRALFFASAAARPKHSWVALDDGESGDSGIVGFVLTAEYDGDTELRGFRSGYLARIGTLRSARGRGIAGALVATTLAGMAADGYRRAELDVDAESPTGAGRIYERLGFTVAARTTLFVKSF